MKQFRTTVGNARRSQCVFTYGIGSIVDFRSGSFMPLGLDKIEWHWNGLPKHEQKANIIHEPRLEKILNIGEFRSTPVPADDVKGDFGEKVQKPWTLPVLRFPSWLQCPNCHRLGKADDPFEIQPDRRIFCTNCNVNVTPVRFVVACKQGHINDFPWEYWAHSASKNVKRCDNPVLYLRSRGKSASLADLWVKCKSCSAPGRSLNDIFNPSAMKVVKCVGNSPWIFKNEKNCTEPVSTLQRGGSNVHFPIIASMISIPPASDAIAKILEDYWGLLSSIPEASLKETLRGFIEKSGKNIGIDQAVRWVEKRKEIDETDLDEVSSRFQEFQALSVSCVPEAVDAMTQEFENTVFSLSSPYDGWVDRIGAVKRLREVRAYCGFSRIMPIPVTLESISRLTADRIIAPLAIPDLSWRPAIEVRGEGIFLQLNEKKVKKWSQNEAVKQRAAVIDRIQNGGCEMRGIEPPYAITPRLLLVHSLAHILIRQLSLDCGYSSSSLKERLYVSEDKGLEMAGLLIYTATPDSDGSLGGLLNLATPERIEKLLRDSLSDAAWCGNDPVCIETDPMSQGERLNGAACHNCLLLPETACEKFNRELDRTMLLGSSETDDFDEIKGYFEGMLSDF